jgi:hypothetical protein
MAEYILRCLRLSSRKFAHDYQWCLHVFDTRNRMAVIEHSRIQTTYVNSDRLNHQIASITVEELQLALNHQFQSSTASTSGNRNASSSALQSIRTAGAKVLGSNEERQTLLRKLYSINNFQGFPHLWLTFSMPDKKTLLVSSYSGALDSKILFDHLRQQDLNPVKFSLPPDAKTPSQMAFINSGDPAACARHFHRIMNIITDIAFGIDPATGKCKSDGGLYGYMKSYVIAVESQASQTLHGHCVAWLHGPPESASQSRAMRNDSERQPQWSDEIANFVDSISTYASN